MGTRQRSKGSVPRVPPRLEGGGVAIGSSQGPESASAHPRREQVLIRLNAALEAQARSIGQALHDESGQMLVAAHNSLADALAIAPAAVAEHLVLIKHHLDTIEEQLRSFSHELRPRILDDLGLVPALRFLAASRSVRPGITVAVACSVRRPIPSAVETALYRFVQEALSNISRHSRATHALLEVHELPGVLRCRISDNGVGFDTAAASGSGLGLLGIRERFDVLGAALKICSSQGQGTELIAHIPLEERNVGSYSRRGRSPGGARQPPRNPRTREVRDRR